jgi:hypothetical protein
MGGLDGLDEWAPNAVWRNKKKKGTRMPYVLCIDHRFDLGGVIKKLTNPNVKRKRQRFIGTRKNFVET